jgi:uncharacterized membrane protein
MGSEGRMDFADHYSHLDAEQLKARWLAATFVLYGLIANGLLAINVPPFQVPDEPNHFLRAAQIADGDIIGTRFSVVGKNGMEQLTAGGLSDPAVLESARPFAGIGFHPNTKVARADWTPDVHWSKARTLTSFPNTVMYPPFFYLPSAVGVIVGRLANLSVLRTLIVSRLLSGLIAIAIGSLAIVVARSAAAWMFAILTLPMSLFLMASASQDGLLIACSSLAGALLVRSLRSPIESSRGQFAWLVVLLSLVGMARPPYGALALLPLGLNKIELRWRIVGFALIVGSVALWSAIVAVTTLTNPGASVFGVQPLAQFAHLWNNPWWALTVIRATLFYWHQYVISFIGDIGWLDTLLPRPYYQAALGALLAAAAATMLSMNGERAGLRILPIAIGLLASAVAIFAFLYITWTPPNQATIGGVTGRYFIPIALAGTALLPTFGRPRWGRIHTWLLALIMGFPALSLAVLMRAIILRYYLQ